MKNILKNSTLTLFAVALCLVVAEAALWIDGRYQDLVSQLLAPSPTIWERPANQIQIGQHPDLKVPIKIRFDSDGVRNHSEPSTREKRNIIGFFGDSFTENYRIEDKFSFTSILDIAARPGARVVNYGVVGYGLDQSYLRYKKYERHDIQHVVYVFCFNDLKDLYATGLTEITQDGNISFNVPKINSFYRFIGRFRLTYLSISAYYKARALFNLLQSGKREVISVQSFDWVGIEQVVSGYRRRLHDEYADAITSDFMSSTPTEDTSRLAQKFLTLIEKWKHEVEAARRSFTVLVLPWKIEDEVATKLLRNFNGNIVHSIDYFENCGNCTFENDGHWNEYGNEKAAEFILSNEKFPFHRIFRNTNIDLATVKIEIGKLYSTAELKSLRP
jgi:hypothetical protein